MIHTFILVSTRSRNRTFGDDPRSRSRATHESWFYFWERRATNVLLRPTLPPIQPAPRDLSPRVKLNVQLPLMTNGPGSVVSIATGYRLDDPRIEPRWGSLFFALVQTGPGAHPASCTIRIGSFRGVKSSRGVTLNPHPF
jgi:hypothetical protein